MTHLRYAGPVRGYIPGARHPRSLKGISMSSTPSTTTIPTDPDPYQPAPDPDNLPIDPDYAQPKIMPSHADPGPVADPGQVPAREPLPGE